MNAAAPIPKGFLRDQATEREVARARSIAMNMGLESQYLDADALGELLDGIVERRLAREAASA